MREKRGPLVGSACKVSLKHAGGSEWGKRIAFEKRGGFSPRMRPLGEREKRMETKSEVMKFSSERGVEIHLESGEKGSSLPARRGRKGEGP